MSDLTDMSTPVTRGEFAQFEIRLEQRLAQLATKADIAELATKAEIAQLATSTKTEIAQLATSTKTEIAQLATSTKTEIAQLATSSKTEIAQLAISTKTEIAQLATSTKAEIAQLATKAELELWGGALLARLLDRIDSSEQRLLAELARHTRASYEDMSTQISVIDEKYADLPPRVSKLETKVLRTKRADR